LLADQVRPKPDPVYVTIQRIAAEGLQNIQAEIPADSEAASSISLAIRVLSSASDDLRRYKHYTYLACAVLALQSLFILVLSEITHRRLPTALS